VATPPTSNGFARFQADIASAMETVIRKYLGDALARARESGGEFDVETPFVAPGSPPTLAPDDRFAADAFQGYMEIGETLERLLDIELYLRRFPFRSTRITRERYLRFHVEAYLHESYILRERLLTFGKRVTRAYKRGDHRQTAASTGQRLEELARALDGVTQMRGRHVHELRFDETRLRNLGALELIERRSSDPVWAGAIKEQYPRVRRHWVRWVREMNEGVRELLDQYFDELHALMFDAGRLRTREASASRVARDGGEEARSPRGAGERVDPHEGPNIQSER
jgi:hypothetical protein